jgi:exodeoxyribonuclease VII large subunit
VQGISAVAELQNALELLKLHKFDFDIVVIVRGGGAKLDLAAFDAFELCKAVAHFPLPVFSGVGHEIDVSVLDMVTHTSMKTPTAVADYIIHHNMVFESNLIQLEDNIKACVNFKIQEGEHALKYQQFSMDNAIKSFLKEKNRLLQGQQEAMPTLLLRYLTAHKRKLDDAAQLCKALHPINVLKRGFTRTLVNGKQSYSVHEANEGDILQTQWADGSLYSKVVKTEA